MKRLLVCLLTLATACLDAESTAEIESASGSDPCAEDSVATEGLEQIYDAQLAYRALTDRYAVDLTELASRGLIADREVAAGFKGGFSFSISRELLGIATKGDRYFFVDESGVIHFGGTCPAASDDKPLGP